MKLTRLQRAGIVASVLWLIGGSLWLLTDYDDGAAQRAALYPKLCENDRDNSQTAWQTPDHCWDDYEHDYEINAQGKWISTAAGTLIVLALGWLLGFAIVRTGRWIFHGRWRP